MLKYFSFVIVIIISGSSVFAQQTELGFGLGANYYKGDLQPTFRPFAPAPAGNIFLRYNANRTFSYKVAAMVGKISGKDSKSGDPYLQSRDFSFNHSVVDLTAQIEYNFLNFRTHNGRYEHDWTPYLFAGLGLNNLLSRNFEYKNVIRKEPSVSNVIIPFGLGFKKILGPRINISGEFSTRVFLSGKKGRQFDGLDGTTNHNIYYNYNSIDNPNFTQWPNTQQKDKYFNVSLKLSYLIYKVNCNNLY